jgi:hypothetical protein
MLVGGIVVNTKNVSQSVYLLPWADCVGGYWFIRWAPLEVITEGTKRRAEYTMVL